MKSAKRKSEELEFWEGGEDADGGGFVAGHGVERMHGRSLTLRSSGARGEPLFGLF